MKAVREIKSIAYSVLDLGTRKGWRVSVTPRPLSTSGKDPVPIVQEAGWAPDRSGQVRKISTPTGIRSPVRPTRSQLLYRLTYPAHTEMSIRNDSWGVKADGTSDNLTTLMCRLPWNFGASTSWNPRDCNGIDLPLPLHYNITLILDFF
jgi:hypothetical protein